jgi:two-component system sensor histidine kinase PfeS
MNKQFFWKLSLIIVAGSMALYWLIDFLSNHTELRMSHIATEHQQQILAYANKAEQLYVQGDMAALTTYMKKIQQQEDTWASIVQSSLRPLAGTRLSHSYIEGFTLGRDVSWKIHLYFKENPVMGVIFADRQTHFLMQLPARMRPGSYWGITSLVLKIALPVVILTLLTAFIYRHMMQPLRRLEQASRKLSQGDFSARAYQGEERQDEFTHVAKTFDAMALRIGKMVTRQREFIADFSHELRTPITRIEMALACAQSELNSQEMLARIELEVKGMRKLAEDSLTLAWLDNEEPKVNDEKFDLVDLLDSIIDDGNFEFPDKVISRELPESLLFCGNSRLLGQAFENIIRNALRYAKHEVIMALTIQKNKIVLSITDDGVGVEEQHLADIFKAFYRIPTVQVQAVNPGFGLGLALAQRQIIACHGQVYAKNKVSTSLEVTGLKISVSLPISNDKCHNQM